MKIRDSLFVLLLYAGCGSPDALGIDQSAAGGATEAGDQFGAVLAVGNFNNDNYDDLVIGGPGEDSGAGAVFIFMGSAGGLGSGFYLKQSHAGGTNEAGDHLGASIATGDLNGDGYDDLVAGAPGEDSGAGNIGVWLGSASGLSAATGRFFFGANVGCGVKEAGDEFAAALAIGDFNADGFADLAAGSPGENSDEGRICIVKGRTATGIAAGGGAHYSQASVPLGALEAGDRFGASLAVGRFTSGLHADLAAGAPGENSAAGAVLVLFGSGSAATSVGSFFTSGVVLNQNDADEDDESGDNFGRSVAVGNLNQDSYDDIIVGAPNEAPPSHPAGGVIFTFHGAPGGPTIGSWLQQTGAVANATTEAGDLFGAAIVTADFDGNGQTELAVASPGEGAGSFPAGSGAVTLFRTSVLGFDVGMWITQEDVPNGGHSEAGDSFGSAVAAGDFNNDGFADLAIGSPGEAPGNEPAGGFVGVKMGTSVVMTMGPILGAVTNNSVKVWVRGNKEVNYRVLFRPTSGGTEVSANLGTLDDAADFTAAVQLTGLTANTQYNYRVLLANVEHFAGTFRTLPAAGTPGSIVFTYGADMAIVSRPYVAFDEAAADVPNFMILGGDNIYADEVPATKAAYEARYRQTFGDGRATNFMQKFPTFMMWDDHEVKNNWWPGRVGLGGRDVIGRQVFDEYQGNHNPAPATAGEIYYSFRAREVDFFVLDTRSHRSPSDAADDTSKSMLGVVQRTALLNWLDTATGKFKFIISSVPFNIWATTGNDSWTGFLTERNLIFNHIGDNNIGGVVLVSGDQHWAGVFRLDDAPPYNFYEFMPTPIGTSNRPLPPSVDPQILYKNNSHVGYGRFNINTAVSPATLTFRWIDKTGVTRFTLTIDEDDIL